MYSRCFFFSFSHVLELCIATKQHWSTVNYYYNFKDWLKDHPKTEQIVSDCGTTKGRRDENRWSQRKTWSQMEKETSQMQERAWWWNQPSGLVSNLSHLFFHFISVLAFFSLSLNPLFWYHSYISPRLFTIIFKLLKKVQMKIMTLYCFICSAEMKIACLNSFTGWNCQVNYEMIGGRFIITKFM